MQTKNAVIAVLSGKGGAGKTLLSVNLTAAAGRAVYLDCDVEEPNGRLFFKPTDIREEAVALPIPVLDEKRCTGCRRCVDFCRFNALALIKKRPYLFAAVCHSCGGCVLLCPEKALGETNKVIGRIERGSSLGVDVRTGVLNPGEESGVPIIRKLMEDAAKEPLPVFIDCPPGASCAVMESIRDADYCVLVVEPTRFGVHDLELVHDLVRLFGKPCGAVLNKCLGGDNPAERFCREKDIPILGQIPFDPELGALSSDARIAAREGETFREMFSSLLETVRKEARHETAAHS